MTSDAPRAALERAEPMGGDSMLVGRLAGSARCVPTTGGHRRGPAADGQRRARSLLLVLLASGVLPCTSAARPDERITLSVHTAFDDPGLYARPPAWVDRHLRLALAQRGVTAVAKAPVIVHVMLSRLSTRPGSGKTWARLDCEVEVGRQDGRAAGREIISVSAAGPNPEAALVSAVADTANRLIRRPSFRSAINTPSRRSAVVSGPKPGPRAVADVQRTPRLRAPARPASFALVVGVSAYGGSLPAVRYAAHDARTFATYATRTLGVPERNVRLLVDDEATAARLRGALLEWVPRMSRALGPGAVLYLYFSGHGTRMVSDGRAALVPSDGAPALATTLISLDEVDAALGRAPVAAAHVFLDTCFSGRGDRSVVVPGARPLFVAPAEEAADRTPLRVPSARFAATGPNQIATSDPTAGHGTFTAALFDAFDGAADDNGDAALTLGELERYLGAAVRLRAARQNVDQSPQLTLGSSGRRSDVLLRWR